MTDHPRLTRYIVYANGTTFMGMLKQNNTHPELFGPDFDWTHGPYVLASEADAEIDRLRAEVERLRSAPHCPTCGCGGAAAKREALERAPAAEES